MAEISGLWTMNNILYNHNLTEDIEISINAKLSGLSISSIKVRHGTQLTVSVYYVDTGTESVYGNYGFGDLGVWWYHNASIVDFGDTPQTVSDEFYEWFTFNSRQGAISLRNNIWLFNNSVNLDIYGYFRFNKTLSFYYTINTTNVTKQVTLGIYTDSIQCSRISGSSTNIYENGTWRSGYDKQLKFNDADNYVTYDFYNWLTDNATRIDEYVQEFSITSITSNCYGLSSNPNIIKDGETATLTYEPNNGYELPMDVNISGATLNSWNSVTGILTISNPTDDVVVSITAVPITQYDGMDNNISVPIFSSTYFNVHLKLDGEGVTNLANLIISPEALQVFFRQSPNDWLTALHFYPIDVVPLGNKTSKLRIGTISTDIDCWEINTGAVYFNLGEYFYRPKFNNFADYNTFTKIIVQLPYYGYVELFPNDVLNKYIQFRLKIDYNSAQAMWIIGVSDRSIPHNYDNSLAFDAGYRIRVLSKHIFKLGMEIPIGATNSIDVYRNLMLGLTSGVLGAVGAYAGSALTAGSITTTKTKTTRNVGTENQTVTRTKTTTTSSVEGSDQYSVQGFNSVFSVAGDTLNAMSISAQSDYPNNAIMTNNLSKNIIIYRLTPKLISQGAEYEHLYGRPTGRTYKLGDIHGYTESGSIHFEDASFRTATDKEMSLIEMEFSNGVILP